MKRIITIEAVKEAVEAAHAHFREEKGGKNADYIPYLKNVPSDLFGISVCLADGRSVTVGDTDYRFGIESVSKVPTAILAMNQYSAKKVLSQIGRRNGTALQLDHGDPAGKRPSFDAAGQRRRDLGLLDDQTDGQRGG